MKQPLWTSIGICICIVIIGVTGCGRKQSIVYERASKGPVEFTPDRGIYHPYDLSPVTQSQIKDGVEVEVLYASPDYLQNYFNDQTVFGKHAGHNPYLKMNLVFYVKIKNYSGQRIHINPDRFVVRDDLRSQYNYLQPDHIIALREARPSTRGMARSTLSATPSIYGVDFGGLASGAVGKSQWQTILLKYVTITPGDIYDGVEYDGFAAFLRPNLRATRVDLILPGIKINFGPDDEPDRELDFVFPFEVQPLVPISIDEAPSG